MDRPFLSANKPSIGAKSRFVVAFKRVLQGNFERLAVEPMAVAE